MEMVWGAETMPRYETRRNTKAHTHNTRIFTGHNVYYGRNMILFTVTVEVRESE